jgi:metal-sulfur cluster biosynthetic enzyme
MPTSEEVFAVLAEIYDPEIPVNIVDLGLIYTVEVVDTTCNITMTLTSQSCPEARSIPETMKGKVNAMEGIDGTEIEIVWDPMWSPQLISEAGREILGIDE